MASGQARFALARAPSDFGGRQHAQRLVGPFKAERMFVTGESVPPEVLYQLGAVEAVVRPAELLATALTLAERIAAKRPQVQRSLSTRDLRPFISIHRARYFVTASSVS
jgi:enoyl-CoA hydratase